MKTTPAAPFRRFLEAELQRRTRDAYTDPLIARYRSLLRAQALSADEQEECLRLRQRMYTRWRWRHATQQALARKQAASL